MNANESFRIGDLIQLFSNPNKQNIDYPFYGINKEKMFMPTVANTEGLDASKYTILKKGMFVFSGMQTGRDVCIRIGLYENESPVLISPAYTTFVVKDENRILPEYLFLFFKRFEMDRYGWFLSDSSIRSNLDWDRFCDIKIPLPDIEVQKKLVSVYSGLKSLAEENEALLQPLANACHAFIVECKSKYQSVNIGEYIELCNERNKKGEYHVDDVRGIGIQKKLIDTKADMKKVSLTSYKVIKPHEFCYVTITSRNGNKISLAMNDKEQSFIVSSSYITFRSKNENLLLPEYLYILLSRPEFDRYSRFNSWGSAREVFSWDELCRVEIPLPPLPVQQKIVDLYNCYEEAKSIAEKAREQLKIICPALVQKAAHTVS